MSWGVDTDADEAANQLVAFVDAGGTFVDTADVYADGETERILGGLLGEVVPRADVVLATKAVARRDDGPFGGGASRGALLTALDGSLSRLGVDHIDLWQLHAWDASVPIEETLATVDAAIASGKVRYVGVSNYTGWQLGTAATWQNAAAGRAPLVSTQVEYSLLERGIEREVVPSAEHHGIGLLPWAPLGRGVLRRAAPHRPGGPDRGSRRHRRRRPGHIAAGRGTGVGPRPARRHRPDRRRTRHRAAHRLAGHRGTNPAAGDPSGVG